MTRNTLKRLNGVFLGVFRDCSNNKKTITDRGPRARRKIGDGIRGV